MLPARRTTDYEETIVTVTSTSGFILKKVFYSVPSRLIGHRLRVRLYDDRLECFLGATPLMTLRRGRPHRQTASTAMSSITGTSSMPCAASRWPCSTWSIASSSSRAALISAPSRRCWPIDGEKQACRTMVGLLALAHDRACEAELAEAIEAELDAGRLPDLDRLGRRFAPDPAAIPDITVELVPLHLYDELGTVRAGRCSMKTTDPDRRRPLALLLAELRLPAVKQVWADARRSGRQGRLAGGTLPCRLGRA